MSATFFQDFRRFASKLNSDVAHMKAAVQAVPDAPTKLQGTGAIRPRVRAGDS